MINQTLYDDEQEQYNQLKNDFNHYYQYTIYPFLKQKEDIRIKFVNRFWFLVLILAFVLPIVMLAIYFFNHYYQKDIDWGFFYLLIAGAIYVVRAPFASYRKQVKNDVMDLFVRFFSGFSYAQGQGLSSAEKTKSQIFPPHDKSIADDCFCGQYKGVEINVFEEMLKKEIYQPKGGVKEKTVFQGIAIQLEMNKNFSGQTIVIKDAGIFNSVKKYSDFERVKLEDVVFEKIFEVYSSNQIEARYLLTTAFMERILKLKELYLGKKIELSFYDNKILIVIDTREDMFEPCSFFKTNLNKEKFDIVFEQFWTIFSIVDILKLNQKLGM